MNEFKREGFTFYKSFYESMLDFSFEEQNLLFRYIIDYALLDKDPTIENKYINVVFKLIKPYIDSSIKKYDQRAKNNDKRSEEAQQKRDISESEPNESRTISENEPKATNTNTNSITNSNTNTNSITNTNSNNIFVDSKFPKELQEKLLDFEEMRNEIKKPLNNKKRKTILKQLYSFSNGNLQDMLSILDNAIVGSYPNIIRLSKDKQDDNKHDDELPKYDTSKNQKLSDKELNDLLALRGT